MEPMMIRAARHHILSFRAKRGIRSSSPPTHCHSEQSEESAFVFLRGVSSERKAREEKTSGGLFQGAFD
jgi:hypothetical protein